VTKPPEKEPTDLDNVLKLVKKLSNEVVDLKKMLVKGHLITNPSTFSQENQTTNPNHLRPQISTSTLMSLAWIIFVLTIKPTTLIENFPQWINSMTLVINQLLEQQSTC
jgi:hypothetical protein